MDCVKFFTLNGANLSGKKGLFKNVGATASCCAHYAFGDKFVTGTPKGLMILWSGNSASKELKGHTDALWQIMTISQGLLTGANDGKILLWDKSLTSKKQLFDVATFSPFPPGIRSLDFNEKSQTLLVGTRSAEILEISQQTGQSRTLVQGHYEGTKAAELWGCAVHPTEQQVATCGADKTIRIWTDGKMLRHSKPFDHDLTSIDWASNGRFLVVGDRNGYIHTVNA